MCGNGLLNTGEECDDSNAISGDGCSSLCKLETGKNWDCDSIGEACLPLCGWSLTASAQWGAGLAPNYVLPSSGSCANITYYDFLQQPFALQASWLSQASS